MFNQLIDKIKKDETKWTEFQDLLVKGEIASKTILLHEGEIANHIFYVKEGCLREWFNKDGRKLHFNSF